MSRISNLRSPAGLTAGAQLCVNRFPITMELGQQLDSLVAFYASKLHQEP
jgi:hypothetical protein